MTNRVLASLFTIIGAGCSAGAVFAHHSFAAVFDGSQTVDVAGVVTEFRFVNPHATLSLEVAEEGGSSVTRVVEFDGELNLINGGWTADSIRVGERVVVHGNPARSGDGRIWFLSLTREDGSQLVRPMLERLNAVEEARRLRAEQRRQQN